MNMTYSSVIDCTNGEVKLEEGYVGVENKQIIQISCMESVFGFLPYNN